MVGKLSVRLRLVFFLLLSVGVEGQTEESEQAEAEAEVAGGDDEPWQYVTYLKTVNEKVENILQETFLAKDARLEQTVSETLNQAMEIRESLLMRIKDIRKGEIKIDESQNVKQELMLSDLRMEIMTILLKLVDKNAAMVDKLKEISKDFLSFKMSVSGEIMRILMLPDAADQLPPPPVSCDCGALANISLKVETLVQCSEAEAEGSGCPPPEMYSMELINVNEIIDNDIKDLYSQIVSTVEDELRTQLFQDLQDTKTLREDIDELITKVMRESEPEKLNKLIQRDLGRIKRILESKLAECQLSCGDGCNSCAAEVLQESLEKMKSYQDAFENIEEEDSKKDFVRSDMIKYINEVNNERREILISQAKATDETSLPACESEKLEIYKMTKGPHWMLVNATIFGELSEVETVITTMVSMLEKKIDDYCTVGKVPDKPINPQRNCEWEEYTETKEYLEKVDDIIQEALFKGDDDNGRMRALLGFVDIQALLDSRVKKLFEEKLECPGEVEIIKRDYMVQLNKCMAEFMNNKIKFSEMPRLLRISCTKVLRNKMEARLSNLLKSELEKNLNEIVEGSGANQ